MFAKALYKISCIASVSELCAFADRKGIANTTILVFVDDVRPTSGSPSALARIESFWGTSELTDSAEANLKMAAEEDGQIPPHYSVGRATNYLFERDSECSCNMCTAEAGSETFRGATCGNVPGQKVSRELSSCRGEQHQRSTTKRFFRSSMNQRPQWDKHMRKSKRVR